MKIEPAAAGRFSIAVRSAIIAPGTKAATNSHNERRTIASGGSTRLTKRKPLPHIAAPDPAQIMLAGVASVGNGERLGWLANQPMQPRRAQRPLDIGFWNPMRNQLEMF